MNLETAIGDIFVNLTIEKEKRLWEAFFNGVDIMFSPPVFEGSQVIVRNVWVARDVPLEAPWYANWERFSFGDATPLALATWNV